MKPILILFVVFAIVSCEKEVKTISQDFSEVDIEVVFKDSISVRAIDISNDTLLGFGFNKGYGFINLNTNKSNLTNFEVTEGGKRNTNWIAEQRAVSFIDNSFFSLGVSSPARLRKVDLKSREEEIVYIETHEKAFYDAIAFWNDVEGIAMGDPTDGCLSIIITRDAGKTWNKVSCEDLPKTFEGEAAFAASNGNIAIVGDKTWIASGGMKSRVFYSSDKGKNWEVFNTPIINGEQTTGVYSTHFLDENNGIIFGGDYTKPKNNTANKAITKDGGKTWKLVADANEPGYKSCVRYVPNSNGKKIVAVGFSGISISNDFGEHWKELSKEGFYTIRFVNDSIAIAAGKGSIAKLRFK